MWNDLNLTRPIQDICEYGKKDAALIESLPDLVKILTSAAEILTENHPIWEEAKIYKNLQTKYKRILHCDKCLQYLQRVSSCLRKMVLLNLSSTYLDMVDKLIIELQNDKDSTYFLPSRQQLEYVLIRTQSATKLICESLHYTRETFCYLIQRLKVGHLIINLMMATSVTARLNIVLKGLLAQLYTVYKKIYPWRGKLKEGGWEWPQSLELPADLESWINLEESEYMKPKHLPKKELDFLTTIFDKNSPSDKADQDMVPSNSFESVEEECMMLDKVDEDNGVLIERSKMEIIERLQSSNSEIIDAAQSTSSDEQIEKPEKRKKSSKEQKVLLKKIKRAADIKELKVIWENLNLTSAVTPEAMIPEKIRLIDKMFLKAKRKIAQLKKSSISETEKKNEMDLIIKISRLKFAKTLGILQAKEKVKKKTKVVIKPVRTFKDLKELYDAIYLKLQSAQNYQKCARLKKLFKDRKADMDLLVESGLDEDAEELIFKTSKMFIADYL